MGKLVVDMFVTLDGVIQAPGGPDEDREEGFRFGGWQAQFFDEDSGRAITKDIERNDALLLGRRTYDLFADYWPKQSGPIADKLNAMPKYVASRTLAKVAWENAELVHAVPKEVAALKAKHREMHTIGSGDLVRSLLGHDLVDELNLWQYPIVLGAGKRLFTPGGRPTTFKLLEARSFPGGAVHLRYARAGKPRFMEMSAEPSGQP